MSNEEKDRLHWSFEEFALEDKILTRFVCELVTRHEAWICIRFKEIERSEWIVTSSSHPTLANLFKASGHPPIGSEAELVAKNGLRDPFTREGADTVCSHFVYRKIGRLTALRPIACSIETLFLAMTLSHI